MKTTTKNSLLNLAIASTLTFAGCSNANKLIVPDGSHRVPINQGQGIIKAPLKQGADTQLVTESAAIKEAESLKEKVALLQQGEQAASARIATLENELANYKQQLLQAKPNDASTKIESAPTPALKEDNLLASTLFKFNQSVLLKTGKTELNDLAKSIQLLDAVQTVEIIGHTDRLGEAEHNEALASKRAKAVRDYLQSQAKLHHLHFEVQSRGGLIPTGKTEHCTEALAHQALIACLSPDRRVEINVYGKSKA